MARAAAACAPPAPPLQLGAMGPEGACRCSLANAGVLCDRGVLRWLVGSLANLLGNGGKLEAIAACLRLSW